MFRSQSSDANFRGASSSKAPMSTVHAIVDGAVIEHQPAVVKEAPANVSTVAADGAVIHRSQPPVPDAAALGVAVKGTVIADGAVGQSQRAKVEDAAAGGASGIATPNS